MRTNKLIIAIATAFVLCMIVGPAWAIDRIEVKVTSEPIPRVSQCAKAGGFSLEFDTNTSIEHGDIIKIDLPNYFNGDQVTLCKAIDFVVAVDGTYDDGSVSGAEAFNTARYTAANTQVGTPGVDNPFTYTQLAPVGADGVLFKVYGAMGGDRITISVRGTTLQVGNDSLARLVLKLFDLKDNGDFGVGNLGLWEDEDGDGVYDDALEGEDNALCVDVFNGDTPKGETTVYKANMDSDDIAGNDKYTFIPSDPQIAHIKGELSLKLYDCDKKKCGNIVLGSTTSTQAGSSSTCNAFDNETGDNYCTDTHNKNRIIIENTNGYDAAQYTARVDILVNGATADAGGVFFSNQEVAYGAYATGTAACDDNAVTVNIVGAYTYLSAAGTAGTPDAPKANDCNVAGAARVVTLITPAFGLTPDNKYLYLDLPAFNYDLDDVAENDAVTVKVTLNRQPCGELFSDTHCIGTFGCAASTVTRQLVYPYFTEMAAGNYFWDGIVVTNMGNTAGTAKLTVYEKDGDVGTMTVNIAAQGQLVDTLSNLMGQMAVTPVGGTLGDASCYAVVCADFNADGFAMISNVDNGESMGYLPRNLPKLPASGDSYDLCD